MSFEKKKRKDIAQMRTWVIVGAKEGGYHQRCRLSAYGFLRGLPYEAIERKTNEDKHCEIGRDTFYLGFSANIAEYICAATETEFSFACPEHKEVRNWLYVRLNQLKEAA